MMNKKIIALRFSKASRSYELWAKPQERVANRLRELWGLKGRVLDIGCGTGFATKGIDAVRVDISLEMAIKSGGMVADAHFLPFKDRVFDTVVSSFSLHWTEIEVSVPEALRVCRGAFIGAIPVEGSLEVFNFPFPKPERIIRLLKGGVEVFSERVEIPYRGIDLLRFLKYTGSSYNPAVCGGIIAKEKLVRLVSECESPAFEVLFFKCEVS
ncbi:MAG: methyltransferase domain-containing protein [Aquificaceae bacterium]|nr:methyltransferase domain-containing protein [Aquificaceae bacterium]MDW8237322.1 methyltransferase domain-containing protein [Aquificaceae bacterium]